MSSYNLSSVVAIAKKVIRKKKFKSINLHNLKVQKQPGLHGKFQESQGLHRDWSQSTKKPSHVKNASPIERKAALSCCKQNGFICATKLIFTWTEKYSGNIKLYSTIFSFCVGCLHAGQWTGISLGPAVQTHVVRFVVPTQSRMFPVLQLQAVIM